MKLLSFLLVSTLSSIAFADNFDGAYLDAPYKNPRHPVKSKSLKNKLMNERSLPFRSDLEAVLAAQSPVKSQASRGTCSIFSATALLESMLYIDQTSVEPLDLSEEWLEYLVMNNRTSDGSDSYTNIGKMMRFGMAQETTWPYIGQTWTAAGSGLALERCGKTEEYYFKSCLLGHRDPRLLRATEEVLNDQNGTLFDPEFVTIRNEAAAQRDSLLTPWFNTNGNIYVGTTDEIKTILASGRPILMDIDFYYGAWNHGKASSLGIERNMDHWALGIIGNPEPGSLDEEVSTQSGNRAGHSVLIVGYDDEMIVKTKVQMTDGTEKEFTYKGVYYFKNSWGKGNFGTDMMINGKNYAGYGMITYEYAHNYGSFFKIPTLK